ncbi:MAG: diguanylate cyclase [Rhodospirillaceae bacterium]
MAPPQDTAHPQDPSYSGSEDFKNLHDPVNWSPEVRKDYWRFTLAYIGALVIVALLTLTIHLVFHYVVGKERDSGDMINQAGAQRMLTQRIAWLSEHLVRLPQGEERAQTALDLEAAVATLEDIHGHLTGQDSGIMLQNYSEALDQIYYEEPHQLDASLRSFLTNARSVLEADPALLDPDFAPYQALVQAAREPLLNALDLSVDLLAKELAQDVDQIRFLSMVLVGVVGVVLVFEALFIFRPATRQSAAAAEYHRQLALTDPLTGCLNRRSFFIRGTELMDRAGRNGSYVCVALLDIDRFKSINDTHGHAVGDLAIKALVEVCLEQLRPEDIFGRLGGEEFGVILPRSNEDGAKLAADRIRIAIENNVVTWDQGSLQYTLSAGVAQVEPEDSHLEAPLDRADKALYAAKHSGRNQVLGYSALTPDQKN